MLPPMNQRLRELVVFLVLFALPFASAFVVEWWAALLVCPLGVIGLIGLNDTLGDLTSRRTSTVALKAFPSDRSVPADPALERE